jgi:hypothetical protein
MLNPDVMCHLYIKIIANCKATVCALLKPGHQRHRRGGTEKIVFFCEEKEDWNSDIAFLLISADNLD